MTVLSPAATVHAARLIGLIDSGERSLFLKHVNTDACLAARTFGADARAGVVFCFMYEDRLRVHIAFAEDTGAYNAEVIELLRGITGEGKDVMVWIRNENRRLIGALLGSDIPFNPPSGGHHYASAEYIMRRECFDKPRDYGGFDIAPYDERHTDTYLKLLDEAMDFVSPPPAYLANKPHWVQRFAQHAARQSFEAFWAGDTLAGLYFRKDAEIDHLAVAPGLQRRGAGTALLTRALDRVFAHTDAPYAYLYCVDWNVKGQAFYKKYGMELNGHSYLLTI